MYKTRRKVKSSKIRLFLSLSLSLSVSPCSRLGVSLLFLHPPPKGWWVVGKNKINCSTYPIRWQSRCPGDADSLLSSMLSQREPRDVLSLPHPPLSSRSTLRPLPFSFDRHLPPRVSPSSPLYLSLSLPFILFLSISILHPMFRSSRYTPPCRAHFLPFLPLLSIVLVYAVSSRNGGIGKENESYIYIHASLPLPPLLTLYLHFLSCPIRFHRDETTETPPSSTRSLPSFRPSARFFGATA